MMTDVVGELSEDEARVMGRLSGLPADGESWTVGWKLAGSDCEIVQRDVERQIVPVRLTTFPLDGRAKE
jgi:hypothetical protein